MKYELKKLPYEFNALEPYIDAKTMEIHHDKHHQAYVNNLNAALEKHPELSNSLEELLRNPSLIPNDIKTAVVNNGGGHFNHDFFWNILKKNEGQLPNEKLLNAIKKSFGSFEEFKSLFKASASTRFGSGWAWLLVDDDKSLKIVSSANQDVPFNDGEPILNLDVWEHAYYLNYQNRRVDYIEAFFNVINWDEVARKYENIVK